jgi:hypothetical protein
MKKLFITLYISFEKKQGTLISDKTKLMEQLLLTNLRE